MAMSISFLEHMLPKRLYHRLASSDIARRLTRGALWTTFGSVVSRLLVLAAMILLARLLGRIQFGEFAVIQATLGVAGIMAGVGLGGTATRFIAQYANTDLARAGRVVALVTLSSVVLVLLCCAGLAALSGAIVNSVLDAPHLQEALLWGLVLMGATALRGVQNGMLAGFERFDSVAKINILEGVASCGGILLLAPTMGVTGALLGLASGAGAAFIAGRVMLSRELYKRNIPRSSKNCLEEWQILTGYTLPNFLGNIVAAPVLWFAMALVGRSDDGYGGLGLYNAAYQWHGPMVFLPMILMSVSMPILVQEWEAGRRLRFRRVTLAICGMMLALSLPPVIGLALLSPSVMSLYGAGFGDGWPLLILLLAAAPLHGIAKIASSALLGMNRAWWVFGANLAWGVALVVLVLWLLPLLGVLSLAIAFLCSYLVLAFVSLGLVLAGSRSPLEGKAAAASVG